MNPAVDLEETIINFDPAHPLTTEEELASFYVDRGSDARINMKTELLVNKRHGKPIKFLFTGHKGSGKSTEVNKLCLELDDQFFIVKVNFRKRPDVTYVDILVKAAMALFQEANTRGALNAAPAQKVTDLWEDIISFVERKIFGAVPIRSDLLGGNDLKLKLSVLGVEFEGKFENEAGTRDQIRKANELRLSEVIDKINLLASAIHLYFTKPVLFVFEDTDKIDLAVAKEIFHDRGPTLTEFNVAAIYLFPIGLRYSTQFSTVKQYFNENYTWLPNINLVSREGVPNDEGIQLLRKLIARRMQDSLMDEKARTTVINASGGLIRTAISLIRAAAVTALGRNAKKIESSDVERAINRLRGDFTAMLEQRHYAILKARHEDKLLSSDQDIQDLLESLALLEYANGKYWCDIHPLFLQEMIERTKND
jgi:hypothetical protein